MKRVFAIAAVTVWVFALVLLRSAVKDFLWTHPWWHSFLVAVPAIALPILASFELRHSGEANTLWAEANRLRAEANALEDQLGTLSAELDAERNKHLRQIADNTKKPVTQAERNASTLRQHLRANVTVEQEHGTWPGTPEIVEVQNRGGGKLLRGLAPRKPAYGRSGIRQERWPELAKEAVERNVGT